MPMSHHCRSIELRMTLMGLKGKGCLFGYWSVQPGGTLDLEGPFGLKGYYH